MIGGMGNNPSYGFSFCFSTKFPRRDRLAPITIRLLFKNGFQLIKGILLVLEQFVQVGPFAGILLIDEGLGMDVDFMSSKYIFGKE